MNAATAVAVDPRSTSSELGLYGLGGVVLEVIDFQETQEFYQRLFLDRPGEWARDGDRLTFRARGESIQFVRRSRPLTLSHTGQHQAYYVPRERLVQVTDGLVQASHTVNNWREDHPAEREVSAYTHDPSGNRVQLVAVDGDSPLLSHVAIEVHDLELAEAFYANVLGGVVDYYHGWKMGDYAEAKAWEEGRDPCAPWTRRFDVRYWDKLRVARPNMQLFVRYGRSVVGLILAIEHRQEPPEEMLEGTPRVVLRSQSGAGEVRQRLAERGVRVGGDGSDVFLRDPGGNFVQLVCSGT